MSSRVITSSILVAAVCGCPVAPPSVPPPIEELGPSAVVEPADGRAPVPMDWLLDDDAREAAGDGFSPAQKELFALWRAAGGWPVTAEIAAPLSTAVVPASAAEGLVLVDAGARATVALEISLDDDGALLRGRPLAPLAEGTRYIAVVKGGSAGLRTPSGAPLERLGLMRALLADHAHDDERLEAVRQSYAEALAVALAVAAEQGLAADDVVALMPFTTTSRPAVFSSARFHKEPFPGDHLVNADGTVRPLLLPEPLASDPMMAALSDGLARMAGFSTTGALLFEASGPVDRESALSPGAVRLFRVESEGTFEESELERGVFPDGRTVWVRPKLTLEPSSRYAWVVTDELRAAMGSPLAPQGSSALAQLSAPLVEGGRSLLLGVSDDEAAAAEAMRTTLFALSEVLTKDSPLALAVTFETLRVAETVLSYTDQLVTRAVPLTLSDVVNASPWDRGLWVAMPHVAMVTSGKLSTLDFLDPVTRKLRAGEPVVREIEFVLTLPEGASEGEPLPVVLFGHGLTTTRELAYGIADELAQHGWAVLAIDLPLHGERSLCDDDAQCAGGASCAVDGACVFGDGTPGRLRQVSSPWEYGPSVPITTGAKFIDPLDLFATRDHWLQGLVDLKQAVRVIRGADFATATEGYVLDGDDIGYAGISLGGIFGAALAGIEPRVHSFALNVPGADFVTMMEDSATLGVMLSYVVEQHGLEQGTEAWVKFETAARWVLDGVDPLNLAHHAVYEPLAYVDVESGAEAVMPFKRLLVQMANNDMVVPNSGTRQLAARTGVEIEEYSPLVSNHGFLLDPTSISGAQARAQLADFLDDGRP